MELLTKQEHCVYYLKDDSTTEVIYGGAAGGGKSAIGCLWLIENCQQYPGSRWLMGRSKLKTLKETTLNTFFELSSKLKLNGQWNYNEVKGVIKWFNGSEIILKDLFLYPSDMNFDSLGSLEITGAFIDECNQLVYKAWQVVKSRIRYKLKEFDLIPKILGTCNPSKNWVYKQFYKPKVNNELKKTRKFIQALPKDNPHLPKSYLDSLLELDKASRQRLYYGNWEYDDDPSSLMSFDAIQDYFNPFHLKGEGDKYITIDVARLGKDKSIIRIWHGYLCIKRLSFKKNRIDELAEVVKSLQLKYGIPKSNVIADEDGVGGGLVDILKCKGFVNNSRALNGENYANLKSQCSFYVSKLVEDRKIGERLYDNGIVDLVVEEMELIRYHNMDKDAKKQVTPKEIIKQTLGRSSDEWDTIMMRGWFDLAPKSKVYQSNANADELGLL